MKDKVLALLHPIIEPLANTSYQSAKAYHYLSFWLSNLRLSNLGNKGAIIVYQMGKVGSSTVVASLKALDLGNTVYHIHTLTKEGLEAGERIYRDLQSNFFNRYPNRSRHLLASRLLIKQKNQGLGDTRWKVVTLVRDPIARNISAFFQVSEQWLPDSSQIRLTQSEDAIRIFLDQYEHKEPLVWFDREFKPALGVDVYASDFDPSEGYKIYSAGPIEILLIRLESLNQCAHEAMQKFLDIDHFNLVTANVAEEKSYSAAYNAFKKRIVLPDSYIEMMYTSRYAQHFYSENEIAAFTKKWCQQSRR